VCWPLTNSGEIDIMEHHGNSGANHFTARAVKSLGYCDGGDWATYQFGVNVNFDWSYHTYSVEWSGNNLVYRVDDNVVQTQGLGNDYPEPMFAILNYAKINNSWMDGEWTMEVNWVKHESWW
jgi:beta-glucanase (GH16 family)